MDKQEIEHFEGLLVKAVQSGKRETSDLVDSVIHKMSIHIDSAVEKSVEKHINGKITKLTKELQDHQIVVTQHYIDDKEWKEQAAPILELGRNVTGFGKVSLYVLGFVASVLGAIILLMDFLKKR